MSSRSRPEIGRILRFGATGLINTALGYAVILVALAYGLGDIAANVTGYAAGLCVSFILHSQWTFASAAGFRGNVAARYVLNFLVAYGANLAIVVIGSKVFGLVDDPFLHLAAIAVYTIVSYLGSTYFVFVAPPAAPRAR